MASLSSSLLTPSNLLLHNTTTTATSSSTKKPTHFAIYFKPTTNPLKTSLQKFQSLGLTHTQRRLKRVFVVAAEETTSSSAAAVADPSSEAARRLYVANFPRTVTNEELQKIVEEHGAVEKAEVMYDKYSGRSRRFGFVTMKTVEDATAAVEKLNGTQIGGREIKVNITEKPLPSMDLSILQAEEIQFVDNPYKVYVGNLAKTVTTDTLKSFFSEKGKVVSAKVSRVPGTSKSSGYGFVTFSSEEEVEAAISFFNNALLEGQKIRVNKA